MPELVADAGPDASRRFLEFFSATIRAVIPVGFDEAHVEVLAPERLSARWSAYPAAVALQEIGDRRVRSRRSVVLRVPSAVVPLESNLLINPGHPDFAAFSIGKPARFAFDRRLRH